MNVLVNGEPTVVAVGTTVAVLAAEVLDRPRGVAVAVNDEVVPKSEWSATELREDDRVEVVTGKAGG